jgi:DNA mismatch repair protein MutL
MVRDKFFAGIIRAAYQDLVPSGRHPAAVLFIEIAPRDVDVNVHPTKAEVRFRDEYLVRSSIIKAIRAAITGSTFKTSSTVANEAVRIANKNLEAPSYPQKSYISASARSTLQKLYQPQPMPQVELPFQHTTEIKELYEKPEPIISRSVTSEAAAPTREEPPEVHYPLGWARCQIKNTYIIAENDNGFVIVDQHAAHERLVLEKMKQQLEAGGIKRQLLLIPEVVELGEYLASRLLEHAEELVKFGLVVEKNGKTQVLVREVPEIVPSSELRGLVVDIAEDIAENSAVSLLEKRVNDILGDIACHNSIRAGKKLTPEAMNAILRQIEQTPLAGQCNHGRPTHTEFKLEDLAKLFERS